MLKTILGYIIIGIPFYLLFALTVKISGWKIACKIYLIAIGIVAIVIVCTSAGVALIGVG